MPPPAGSPDTAAPNRPEPRSSRRRIVGLALLYTALFAVALVLIWLVGANYVLGFDGEGPAADWINRKPEKFALHWRSASTLYPGRVTLHGVTLRGQSRTVQWWASLDRADIDLALTELPERVVHIRRGSAQGVRFRLRRRVAGPDERLDHEPPIPGFENPPVRPPEELYPEPPKGPGWHILLDRLHLDGVREIWIENSRFSGDGSLRLGMDFDIRDGALTLAPLRLALDGGVHTGPTEPQITDLTVAWNAVVDRLDAKPDTPSGERRVLEAFSGELDLAGDVRSLELVERYLPPLPGLALDGHGRFTSHLVLEDGSPRAGTEFTLGDAEVRMDLADYRARGRGELQGRLRENDDPEAPPGARLDLRLTEYALSRGPSADGDEPDPYLFGRELHLDLDVPELPAVTGPEDPEAADEGLEGVRAVLELPEATVPDLTVYNDYLPPAAGARITGGSGRLRGRFELDGTGRGRGEIHLTSSDLRGRYDGLGLTGRLRVDTALPAIDLAAGRFDLGGSRLRADRVRVTDAGTPEATGWWIRVDVPAGALRPGREPLLDARVAARMRDSGPLLSLFARHKAMVGWFDDLLTVEDLTATGRVWLGTGGVRLRGVEVEGEGLRVLADLRLAETSKTGLLYAKRGPFSVGAELTGDDVDWKLRQPLRWYRQRSGHR